MKNEKGEGDMRSEIERRKLPDVKRNFFRERFLVLIE
jgi:hypothetical protein